MVCFLSVSNNIDWKDTFVSEDLLAYAVIMLDSAPNRKHRYMQFPGTTTCKSARIANISLEQSSKEDSSHQTSVTTIIHASSLFYPSLKKFAGSCDR